jgi:hypothetical protein
MQHHSDPNHTPVPRVQPRKGFAWLPQQQQLAVVALLALLLLTLLPAFIDSGRAGSGSLKQARSRPPSVAAAITRIQRHYGLAWIMGGSAGERRVRTQIAAISLVIAAGGALAGWKTQQPTTPATANPTTPRIYGDGSPIRARAALTQLAEADHG